MVDKTIVAVSQKCNVKKKCKESKDKLIVNLSDYFVLHKILETANSENQDFSRHPRQERMSILSCPRLKVDFYPKGYFFQDSCISKGRGFRHWLIYKIR